MDFLSVVQLPAGALVYYVIPFLAALTVIVFIHELGHFLVARWCGVSIEAFSIGFGKEITGWYDRHGTRWKLAWIPLGGYVKFKGDANAASFPDAAAVAAAAQDPGSFHGKPLWQRAAVVAAGPIANFILAIVIFAAAFMTMGTMNIEPRIFAVQPGSAAEKAGLQSGDLILKIDGRAIKQFADIQQAVVARAGDTLPVVVDRAGSELDLSITPELREESDGFGGKIKIGRLGIMSSQTAAAATYERLGPVDAVREAVGQTWFIVDTTFRYLGKMITGRQSADQLSGPIGMATAAGNAASQGIFPFINIIAFLSVSIGLINLFPIPMLDGGHLVYYAIEAVRGRPLGEQAQEWGFRIGLSIVVLLMVVGTWNDLTRQFFGG